MALSVWFIVIVLLATGECFQTAKAQDQADNLSPADSPQAISSPAASPAESPPAISTSNPPAVFVFGDSLVDAGNNNYIQTLAKANIQFNGIDYPGGEPTGRFCNGRTVVDILCDLLGVPYPPPFLDPRTSSRILRGVSYASGAGGILDETGANFLDRISMNQQIKFFQEITLSQLEAQIGTNTTTTLLAASLVAIIIGSNDYINNYLLVDHSIQHQYTSAQFNVLLINSFSRQLKELYGLGFRMFFISGIGPLGCTPHQLAISGQPYCVPSVNAQAQDFNALVKPMLQDLNSQLSDAMFLFGDSYTALSNIIDNPAKYGFKVVNEGCCGGGMYRAQILCQPTARYCSNRKEYVFWDAYHPTEASNLHLANAMYTGGLKAITPMNVQQLLALKRVQP